MFYDLDQDSHLCCYTHDVSVVVLTNLPPVSIVYQSNPLYNLSAQCVFLLYLIRQYFISINHQSYSSFFISSIETEYVTFQRYQKSIFKELDMFFNPILSHVFFQNVKALVQERSLQKVELNKYYLDVV